MQAPDADADIVSAAEEADRGRQSNVTARGRALSVWAEKRRWPTRGPRAARQAFEQNDVDGPMLLELSEDLLEDCLYVKNPIHRKKILAHAKLLPMLAGLREDRALRTSITNAAAARFSWGSWIAVGQRGRKQDMFAARRSVPKKTGVEATDLICSDTAAKTPS